jgi:hypothetical protein
MILGKSELYEVNKRSKNIIKVQQIRYQRREFDTHGGSYS